MCVGVHVCVCVGVCVYAWVCVCVCAHAFASFLFFLLVRQISQRALRAALPSDVQVSKDSSTSESNDTLI
jgi:hypothetical protein